jgi:hypothetical protein
VRHGAFIHVHEHGLLLRCVLLAALASGGSEGLTRGQRQPKRRALPFRVAHRRAQCLVGAVVGTQGIAVRYQNAGTV